MKQDKDWMQTMRSALRDAELTPPADGWARLEREIGSAPAPAPVSAPRSGRYIPAWRVYTRRIAAVAAVVAIGLLVGDLLWREAPRPEADAPVLAAVEPDVQPRVEASSGDLLPDATQVAQAVVPKHSGAQHPQVSAPRQQTSLLAAASSAEQRADRASSAAVRTAEKEVSSAPASDASASEAVSSATESRSDVYADARSQDVASSASRAAVTRSAPVEEPFVAYVAPRKKASFGLFATGGVLSKSSSAGAMSRSISAMTTLQNAPVESQLPPSYDESSFRHHQPLGFGLSARKEFAHGFSLESGVNYTLLWSDVRMPMGTEDVSQKLHMIGIPLRVNWNFLDRPRFRLYIGAGGMFEKCISAKFGSQAVDEPAAQWSVMGAVGAEYRLGGMVGLYFEPDVSYYFTETNLRTARSDSPATFTLRLGVRLSF